MLAVSPNITKITSVSQELIVSVDECGKWLNLTPSPIALQNDMLEELIISTTEIIEDYTWLSLRRKTFQAYYDLPPYIFTQFCDGNLKLSLMRSPILTITDIGNIEYLNNNNTWTVFDKGTMTIDGLYENVTEREEQNKWATIKLKQDISFQNLCNAYKIRVTFTAGYNPTETNPALKIPERIKTAIKQIVAFHYTYRGDCQSDCALNGYPVPCQTKGIIDSFSIKNSMIGTEYTPSENYCGWLL